jgi:hypothetical protein
VHELLLDRRRLRAAQIVQAPVRRAVDLAALQHGLLEQRGDPFTHPARRRPRARPARHRLGVRREQRMHELLHQRGLPGLLVDQHLRSAACMRCPASFSVFESVVASTKTSSCTSAYKANPVIATGRAS